MLNFFVLGHIPGTHFQVTFSWVIVTLGLGIVIMLLIFDFDRLSRFGQQKLSIIVATALLRA